MASERMVLCLGCSDPFVKSHHYTRFCSRSCATRYSLTGQCTDCAARDDVTGRQVPLCPVCRKTRKAARQRRWLDAHPNRANDHYVAKTRRRRALKAGLLSEPYTLSEIAERDGYLCGWCWLPVNMILSGLERWGPTIDHVIPISRGGPDTKVNVQLMHRVCNETKGVSGNDQ